MGSARRTGVPRCAELRPSFPVNRARYNRGILDWPEDPPELANDRILLRPLAPADAIWVYEACQDPDIQKWTRVPVPFERRHAEGFVGAFALSAWREGAGCHCAIEEKTTGNAVGTAALTVLDAASGVVAAGYWVASQYRGRGMASGALRLLSEWGFSRLDVVRIELYVDTGNDASVAAGKQVGFEEEGVLRQKVQRLGEQRDVLMLAKVRKPLS